MKGTITERITQLMTFLNENPNSFSGKVGVTRSTIQTAIERNKGVNSELIQKIANVFPAVSLEWLILGEGEMIKGENVNNVKGNGNTSVAGNGNNITTAISEIHEIQKGYQDIINNSQIQLSESQSQISRLIGVIEEITKGKHE